MLQETDALYQLHARQYETQQSLQTKLNQAILDCKAVGEDTDYRQVYDILARYDLLPNEAYNDIRELQYEEICALEQEKREHILQAIRSRFDELRNR